MTATLLKHVAVKRLKTLSTYQENIAWIKVADITLEILRGTFVIMSPPSPNIGGTCPPVPYGSTPLIMIFDYQLFPDFCAIGKAI